MTEIRKAVPEDLDAVAGIYEELFTFEKLHGSTSNWKAGVYPTRKTAEAALAAEDLYVLTKDGRVLASMRLNTEEPDEYRNVPWKIPAEEGKVLVIHTLCVSPSAKGQGLATKMLSFAEDFARKNHLPVSRIDTWAHNEPAKTLYQKNGYTIAGYARMLLAGLIDEDQVFLEKSLL